MTDPQTIISTTIQRKLRPGEAKLLSEILAAADRKIEALEASIARLRALHEGEISDLGIRVELQDNHLVLQFPNGHHIRLPLGSTQHDRAIAMQALLGVLRERQGKPSRLGTVAAPVQYDVQALLSAARKLPGTKVPPGRKAKRPAPKGLTLADLEIEI